MCDVVFGQCTYTLTHTHIRPNVSVMIWDDVIFFKHFQECLECSVRPFVGCFCLGLSASEEFLFLNCLNETNAICLLVFLWLHIDRWSSRCERNWDDSVCILGPPKHLVLDIQQFRCGANGKFNFPIIKLSCFLLNERIFW